ncbi:sigma 54-interacting transcriptional regulator [Sorangium sp. So ce185]
MRMDIPPQRRIESPEGRHGTASSSRAARTMLVASRTRAAPAWRAPATSRPPTCGDGSRSTAARSRSTSTSAAGLLRVLEERRFRPLGEDASEQRADVRFLVRTNADLHADVRSGRFREDLYYQINVLPAGPSPIPMPT